MIQEPSYHLEGVVHARDELEDFTGPLDLILMLLAKDKIEIRDIQISQLLDQYLAYLQKMQEMDLEIASEFVQMASHLMYIKTKMLLTEEKEPTELEVLVSALEQLKNRDAIAAVREVAPEIGQLAEVGMKMQTRGPLPLPERPYDYRHTPAELLSALAQILLRGTGESAPEENETLCRAEADHIQRSGKERTAARPSPEKRAYVAWLHVRHLQKPQRARCNISVRAGALLRRAYPRQRRKRKIRCEPCAHGYGRINGRNQ